MDDLPSLINSLITRDTYRSPLNASGDAAICINGEIHNGTIDIQTGSSGALSASIYGPLGVSIASIRADSIEGLMNFDRGTHSFRRSQKMDSLPYAWGRDLSFNDLTAIITGGIPDSLKIALNSPPDATQETKKTINLLWKTDNLTIKVSIRKKDACIEAMEFLCTRQMPWSLTLSNFIQGYAYKIKVREDDKNYFLITYKKVRYN
jgi:hypothetical protein